MKTRYINRITQNINERTCAANLYKSMERVLQQQDENGEWRDVPEENEPFSAWLIEANEKRNDKQMYMSYLDFYSLNEGYMAHWTFDPDEALTFASEEKALNAIKIFKENPFDDGWRECYTAEHLFNCGTIPIEALNNDGYRCVKKTTNSNSTIK